MANEIFICYRRVEADLAERLHQGLEREWGFGGQLFRDVATPGGERWNEYIRSRLDDARVLLALAGPEWDFRKQDLEAGETDFVGTEFARAIEREIPILLVAVGRADHNRVLDGLPKSVRERLSVQQLQVSDQLDSVDLRAIVEALARQSIYPRKDLDPFSLTRPISLDSERAEATDAVRAALARLDGSSSGVAPMLVLTTPPGRGRNQLLRAVAGDLRRDALVLGGSARAPIRNRSFAVVAAWFADLIEAARVGEHQLQGITPATVAAALVRNGHDLLTSRTVPVEYLADLGDHEIELAVIRASSQASTRQAWFNPRRLLHQVRPVLQQIQNGSADRPRAARGDVPPLVLIAGDLERLDASSREVIDVLRRRWYRNTDTADDRDGRHPGGLLVLAVAAEGTVDRHIGQGTEGRVGDHPDDGITVVPIGSSLQGVSRLTTMLAERAVVVDPAVVRRVADGGYSPYFTIATLRHLVERGWLTFRREDKTWVSATSGEGDLPSVAELLDEILDRDVGVELRPLLTVGALMGSPFCFELAHHVARECDGFEPTEDEAWARLQLRAGSGATISLQKLGDGQRWVTMHADVVLHLGRPLTPEARQIRHERLAALATGLAEATGDLRAERTYLMAAIAAEQWTAARHLLPAAEAHCRAAETAESQLAFDLARTHYRRAAALFQQCADEERSIAHRRRLAHSLYRHGRLLVLAGDPAPALGAGSAIGEDATALLDRCLLVLDEVQRDVRAELDALDRLGVAEEDAGGRLERTDELRRERRRAFGLSAYAEYFKADLARRSPGGGRAEAAALCFAALRHAEASREEGDSRWVLAAASARLAELLRDEAIELLLGDDSEAARARLEQLRRNIVFHAERALGIRALDRLDQERLAEPRAWAHEILGRTYQWLAARPDLAAYHLEQIEPTAQAGDARLDRTTDLAHALFLLTTFDDAERRALGPAIERADDVGGRPLPDAVTGSGASAPVRAARVLTGVWRWSEATRMPEQRAVANGALALAWLAATGAQYPMQLPEQARHRAEQAARIAEETDCLAGGRIFLLAGLTADLCDKPEAAERWYRNALAEGARHGVATSGGQDGDALVERARRRALARLLVELPSVGAAIVETWGRQVGAVDPTIERLLARAADYERLRNHRARASFDEFVHDLSRVRLPAEEVAHADTLARHANEIVDVVLTDLDELARADAKRDLALAASVHDWFSGIDPARLLVLAHEWDIDMTGVEWADPVLLHGKLALEALRRLHNGRRRLGTERFGRLEAVVATHTVGGPQASPIAQAFCVADWWARPADDRHGSYGERPASLPSTSDELWQAYRQLFERKAAAVLRKGGLPAPETRALLAASGPPA